MLSILCPHCQTKLTVEEQWRGRTVNCLSCGKQLAIAAVGAAQNTPPADPSLVISRSSGSGGRRRKRAVGNRVISTMLHLSITAATVYAGFYLISTQRASAPQEVATPTTAQPKPAKPKIVARSLPKQVERETPAPLIEIAATAPQTVVEPPVSPFLDSPEQVTLPSVGDLAIVNLASGLADTDFRFLSNSPDLAHSDRKILWSNNNNNDDESPTAVAGLALIDGALKFRWMALVPEEAETAIRNSIVRLNRDDRQHVFTLRSAASTEPFQIDLSKAQQRIISKCDHVPAAEDICFELIGIDELPDSISAGDDLARLQIRGQSTLQYLAAEGAVTRLDMKKRGRLVLVELKSHYVLPSGDEQPMSIAHGNSKLKELEALVQKFEAAEKALPGLRSHLKNVQRELRDAPRSRATATAKSVRLGQLQNELAATQQKIGYAERLFSQKMAIAADHQAIQQVAKLAQQLHKTKVAYRFFTVVDGHEVDILVAQ